MFLQMGAKCGAALLSLCSKLNRSDRVSGMIFNLPGLCSTVKSYDCSAIAYRVSIFDVSCMEYDSLHKQSGDPRYSISNESPLALLRGILFELLSNDVDLK